MGTALAKVAPWRRGCRPAPLAAEVWTPRARRAGSVGLPSSSTCPHPEDHVGLDPGLRARAPGQSPASSWEPELGSSLLQAAAPPGHLAQQSGLRPLWLHGLTASLGRESESRLRPSLQNVRAAQALDLGTTLHFDPCQSIPGASWPCGLCFGPWPVSRGDSGRKLLRGTPSLWGALQVRP